MVRDSWAVSLIGKAVALQAIRYRFDSDTVHFSVSLDIKWLIANGDMLTNGRVADWRMHLPYKQN